MARMHSKDWYVEDEWLDTDTLDLFGRQKAVEDDIINGDEEGIYQMLDADAQKFAHTRDDEDIEFMLDTFSDDLNHAA